MSGCFSGGTRFDTQAGSPRASVTTRKPEGSSPREGSPESDARATFKVSSMIAGGRNEG